MLLFILYNHHYYCGHEIYVLFLVLTITLSITSISYVSVNLSNTHLLNIVSDIMFRADYGREQHFCRLIGNNTYLLSNNNYLNNSIKFEFDQNKINNRVSESYKENV